MIYRNETALVYAECNGDLTRLVPSAKTELVGVALGNLESDGLCKVSAGIVAGVVTVFIKLKDVAPRICARPGDGEGTRLFSSEYVEYLGGSVGGKGDALGEGVKNVVFNELQNE